MERQTIKFELSEEQKKQRFLQIEALRKDARIQNFLKQHNLPLSILDEYSSKFIAWLERLSKCKGCQGLRYCRQPLTGRVQTLDVDDQGFLMDIYRACKYEQEEEKRMMHRRNYKIFDGSYNDLLIDEESVKLEKESHEYIEAFVAMTSSYETEKGVYLYGQPGTGKTYLCRMAANHYAKSGMTVSFVNLPQCIQDLKQNMADSKYRLTMISRMKFCDVLFLDDIGSESISAWTRDEILFPILEYRMNNRLKTYFSSNYTLPELKKQYAKVREESAEVAALRIIERIQALATLCPLLGRSRRFNENVG